MERFTKITEDKRELLVDIFEMVDACASSRKELEQIEYLEELLFMGDLGGSIKKLPIGVLRVLFKGTVYEETANKAKVTWMPYYTGLTAQELRIIKPLFVITQGYGELDMELDAIPGFFRMFEGVFLCGAKVPDNLVDRLSMAWSLSSRQLLQQAVRYEEEGLVKRVSDGVWRRAFYRAGSLDHQEVLRLKNQMEGFLLDLETDKAKAIFKEVMARALETVSIRETVTISLVSNCLIKGESKEKYPEGTTIDRVFEALGDVLNREEGVNPEMGSEFGRRWGIFRDGIDEAIEDPEFAPVLEYIRGLGFKGTEKRFYDISKEDYENTIGYREIIQAPFMDYEETEQYWGFNPKLEAIVLYDY